ncbi:MAG: FG-GAP-like repeat-containing protein [Bacteroidales bacterium]|nr:FG-GAP-like repeat-containing protein [Bacteroidales bacterium]
MSLRVRIAVLLAFVSCLFVSADEIARPMTNYNVRVSQGAALVDLPIATPSGAGGLKPDLRFFYNSEAANGLLGMGWMISPLPKITTTGKTIFYDNTVEPIGSAFLLNGERIIEYKKECDTIFYKKVVDDNTIIAKYDDKFRVLLPNGNVQTYVESLPSSYCWLLQSEKDKNSNEILYSWACQDGETPRISEISYNQKGANDQKVSVSFSYTKRTDSFSSLYAKRLVKTNYLLSEIKVTLGGNLYRQYALVYDIKENQSVLKQVVETGVDGNTLPPYTFQWETEPTIYQFKNTFSTSLDYLIDKNSTNWTFADYDDDGEKELVSWGDTYVKFYAKNKDGKYVYKHQMNAPDDWKIIQPIFGCFFDPHKTDVLVKFEKNGSDKVYIGNLSTKETLIEKSPNFTHIVADIDNDGCDELIGHNQTVWIKDWNNEFSEFHYYLSDISGDQILVSDINGDGLLDIILGDNQTSSSVVGTTLYAKGWANLGIFINAGVTEGKISFFQTKVIKFDDMHINLHDVADFNGDGLPDILYGIMDGKLDVGVKKSMYEYENKQSILYNRGGLEFEDKRLNDSYDMAYPFTEKENNKNDIKVGDFNGDGKADLLFLSARYTMKSDASRNSDPNGVWGEWKDATIAFYTSTGESFKLESKKTISEERNCFLKSSIQIHDLNNNGISEAVHFMGYDLLTLKESGRSGYFTEFSKEKLKPYLRTIEQRVMNSMVDYFVLSYERLSEEGIYSTPVVYSMPASLYKGNKVVVSRLSFTGQRVYSYKYGSLYYEKTGKGFIGFLNETVTDETSKIVTEKEWSYSKPSFIPFSYRERAFDEDGNELSLIDKSYRLEKRDGKKIYRVSLSYLKEKNYLNNTLTTTSYKDMNSAFMPQTIVTKKGIDGGPTKTEKIVYDDVDGGSGLLKKKVSTYWSDREDSSSVNLKHEAYFSYDEKDRLVETFSKPTGTDEMKVTMKYDSFGNVVQLDSSSSGISKKYSFEFDRSGVNLSSLTNPLGVTVQYEYSDGNIIAERSPLGRTSYERNGFGDVVGIIYPNGSSMNRKYSYTKFHGDICLSQVDSSSLGTVKQTVTNEGRLEKESATGFGGRVSTREYFYENGRQAHVVNTYGDKKPRILNKYNYDKAGRVVLQERYADSLKSPEQRDFYGNLEYNRTKIDSVRYVYDERFTTKIYGADTIVSEIDDAGRTISVTKNGKRVDFAYDAMCNMLSATPQDGEPVTLEYNSLSLRTKINDPSGGEITSEYNGFGYLLQSSQCVHKAGDTIVSRQTYNEVGQLVESQIGNQTLKYVYDAYGRPVSCGNDIHEQSIVYDKFGNIASVTEQIDGLTFAKSITYDKKGRPESTTSPTGLNIRLNYDPYSNVDAIQCDGKEFWRLTDTDESGKPTKETYGGIVRTTKYDNRGLPILDDVAKLMHYEYLFDTNGDMLQKKETYSKQEEVYLFDQHNRLNIWRTFEKDTLRKEIFASYDDIFGNITSRSDSDFVFNYGEFGLSPHALTSIDAPIRGHERENSYTYTDFKMLESATNGVDSIFITYGVDFQRRRMKIFKNDSLILTRYYFSDYEEEHYADGRVRKIDYITGPTGLIGVNISTDGLDTLLYAFTDRFGNLVMLVDDKGNVVEKLAYDPWGARRNPGDWTKPDTASHLLSRGYSMHEHLDCLGLINMNARVYEPVTCSFLSPDPLIADEGSWLNYNRYLYCLGNPVKFADPTGMQVLNPTYDVEGIYKYLPLPINVPEPSFDYIVTDNSWEEQAMATVRFNNAMYELNRTITAGANNAMAFIGHDRDAAVQRALANAAVASAQADAAARAAGDVGRNAMNGIPGPTTFEKVSLVSSLIGTNQTFKDAIFTLGKVDFGDLGTVGKVMTSTSTAVAIGGTAIGIAGGVKNVREGNSVRGYFDIGMAIAGGVGASMVSNLAVFAGCAWAGPVGWTLIGVSVAYSVTFAFIDVLDN